MPSLTQRIRSRFFSALFMVTVLCPTTTVVHGAESTAREDQAITFATLEEAFAYADSHDPALRALAAEEHALRADRGEARSLPNPEATLSSKHGAGETFGDNWEAGLHMDLGGVLSTPWRFREADARARAAQSHLAEARAARRFEVAQAWTRAVAARTIRDLEAAAASTWNAEAELARRRRAAGTLNALDLAETEAAAAQARLALRRAARDADVFLADLAGAIGALAESVNVAETLPSPPADESTRAHWSAVARRENPELTTAQAEAEAARRTLALERVAVLPRLTAGATYERDGLGRSSIAPEIGIEVPLFNLGFARRARARADYDGARHRVGVRESALEADLAALQAELQEAREAYSVGRDTIVPLRKVAAEEALRHYNFMLVGVDRLLAARREELAAQRALVESQRDYWIARAALDRATGGPTVASAARTPGGPNTSPPSSLPSAPPAKETGETPHKH